MAITFVEGQGTNASSTTPAFTTAISGTGSAGSDLILAFSYGGSPWTNTGFTDNINSGIYNILFGTNGYTGSNYGTFQIGYKICNASGGAGTFAVTATGTSVPNRCAAVHLHGFTNTAQFPAADVAKNFTNSNSSAINSGSFNASFNNEFIMSWCTDNSGFANPVASGWILADISSTQFTISELVTNFVSSGSSQSLVATANDALNPWVAFCFGFYDGTGIIPPPPVPSRGPMPKQIYIMP